jgi:2-octaprenyl-6-methoxyphenol hydroxylase
VAIVGGGPAGMALALALHRQGVAAEIFDARSRDAGLQDQRILALSHGARQILEWLDVWQAIPSTPITTIHISQQSHLGRAKITATEEKVPALGYVLAARDLIAALDGKLRDLNIPFGENTPITAPLADAPLTVWAEGSVDAETARRRDYNQHGVIFLAQGDRPHGGMAWERFTPQGPVAVLPYGADYAVVVTCAAAEAETIAALDDERFLALLQQRFGSRIRFTGVGPRVVYPLGLRYRPSTIAERQVWIGNAAQTLHPVAGQGFNLALRDIYELARSVATAADPGSPAALQHYAAQRRLDRNGAMAFTDTLVRLFSNDNPVLGHLRGAGLLALDLLPPARSFVARRMMFGARGW